MSHEEDVSETAARDIANPIDPIVPAFREWAVTRDQVTALTTRMNHQRDRIIAAVEARGYADHKGHQYIDLPFALQVGDTTYTRIKRERRVTVVADEDAAKRIAIERGVLDRAFPSVPALDEAELYVLFQEEILTEADMGEIFTKKESFAFRGVAA